jgi:hypothetical protein
LKGDYRIVLDQELEVPTARAVFVQSRRAIVSHRISPTYSRAAGRVPLRVLGLDTEVSLLVENVPTDVVVRESLATKGAEVGVHEAGASPPLVGLIVLHGEPSSHLIGWLFPATPSALTVPLGRCQLREG